MKISANLSKTLHQEIALLLWRYGRSDLVQQMGLDEAVALTGGKSGQRGEATPEQLANDLEAMGPLM